MVKSNHQIPILDNLRAIAAWAVCLYHFIYTTVGFIDHNSIIFSLAYFGRFGVNLFFIISGLVIPWSLYHNTYQIKDFFKFFIKRLIRLEPPYLISIVIMLGIIFIRKYNPAYKGVPILITGKQILFHIGYLIPWSKDLTLTWLNNIYWTLAIEFQYYIVIGVLYFLLTSKKGYLRLISYIILFGSKFVIPLVDFLPYWLSFFGIGILIFLYRINRINKTELIIVSLLFIIDIFLFNERTAAVITTISELTILLLFNQSNKVLAWLGKSSYSVYLMHAVLGVATVNFLSHYANTTIDKVAVVIAGLIITFCSSYLMYLLVEKPSKKLSGKLAYGRKHE